jgi:Resolvase, N terminal domain
MMRARLRVLGAKLVLVESAQRLRCPSLMRWRPAAKAAAGRCLRRPARRAAIDVGRAMFGMLGIFAEFEREMIHARVVAGLDRVRGEIKRNGHYTSKAGKSPRDPATRSRSGRKVAICPPST